MNWIFGTLAEFEGSPVMINTNSISMIAGSIEGGCAIFFTEPQSRIALRESYDDIYSQLSQLKKIEGDADAGFFEALGKQKSNKNPE